jgi:glutaredoxin
MKVKFFYKNDCPKCPAAKELVQQLNCEVEMHSLDETDGLAEAAFYNVMSTPSIIISNAEEKEVVAFRGEVPSRAELEKWLKQ